MRAILIGLMLLLGTAADQTASAEVIYPWCRQPAEGGNNCGFTSFEQCMGESSGKGAFCIENSLYRGPARPPALHVNRHRR